MSTFTPITLNGTVSSISGQLAYGENDGTGMSLQNQTYNITISVNAQSTAISGSGSYTLSAASIVEGAVTATTTATLTVKPAAPSVTPGSFILGNPTNPSNTTGLISPNTGATLNFYTSTEAGAASSSAQTTPTTPGVYTYYVSQTSSIGVESILVPYTITIKPIAPPINRSSSSSSPKSYSNSPSFSSSLSESILSKSFNNLAS